VQSPRLNPSRILLAASCAACSPTGEVTPLPAPGGAASMFRTSILALIFGFTSITAFAEDARQLTCSGMMIEPSAMSQSPETVILTLGPAQKVALDLGQGVVNARKVSDNKIQLKFRTKDFEGARARLAAT
jgi:hypothetical protein